MLYNRDKIDIFNNPSMMENKPVDYSNGKNDSSPLTYLCITMFLLFYTINNVLQNFAQIVGIHNPENEAGVNYTGVNYTKLHYVFTMRFCL